MAPVCRASWTARRAFDDKRSLGGAAVAPGEGAHQGDGGVGGGGDDLGGGGVAALRGCHCVQGVSASPQGESLRSGE